MSYFISYINAKFQKLTRVLCKMCLKNEKMPKLQGWKKIYILTKGVHAYILSKFHEHLTKIDFKGNYLDF